MIYACKLPAACFFPIFTSNWTIKDKPFIFILLANLHMHVKSCINGYCTSPGFEFRIAVKTTGTVADEEV